MNKVVLKIKTITTDLEERLRENRSLKKRRCLKLRDGSKTAGLTILLEKGGRGMTQDRFEQAFDQYKQQSQLNAFQESSNPQTEGQESIIAVRKNGEGDIIAFKTASGRELDYLEALREAKEGRLAHVDVFERYGREIIRSEPDGIRENNLDNLDTF